MRIRVSGIRHMGLRRLAICASIPFLLPVILTLGALLNILHLLQSAHKVWTQREAEPETCEVGVVGDALVIRMPLDLLVWATEHSPMAHHLDPDVVASHGGLRVTDKAVFAESVKRALLEERDESGSTLVHELFDDAVERVVDDGGEGFVWPAAGIE